VAHRSTKSGTDLPAENIVPRRLAPGDQLPKVREVAQSLAINPNTVLKTYRELELEGLAEG
jgi:DNA-binding transcriptional regulator YhcF (GntR family)